MENGEIGGILKEVKKRISGSAIVEVEEKKVGLVIFSLAGTSYAFWGSAVKEILRYERVAYVPGSPDYILGIINVRGEIESVLNLHRMLGLSEASPSGTSRIIIAADTRVRSGILVDSVEDVVDVPASCIQPPTPDMGQGCGDCVAGVAVLDNKNIMVLDLKELFRRISQ